MIISTSDEDMFFLAHKEGQFDKDGAWISSVDLLQHQYVSFTMPEACNRVFFIGWEDQFTPVRASYLRLNTYDIAENDEGKEYLSHVATEVITYIQTPCETTMDEGYATALAVSPLREDGSRQVFIISGAVWGGGSDVRQIIVHADGTYSDIEQIGTLPFVVHGSKLMEFTPDGTKVLVKDCERSVFHVIEVSSLDVTSLYLDPEEEVSGFEYIPKEKLGSTYDRIYFSYHHHGNLSEGGIRYVDDMGGVLGAMQQVFTSASPAAFGYTEIEYARDGKIYFAYKPDYNSSSDINVAGTLYAFDPTLAATNVPVQASASGISEIPVYSRLHNHYFIQSQIDGDAQDFMPYGVTFTLNGYAINTTPPPTLYLCDGEKLDLEGMFTGSVKSYVIKLDTGIIAGSGPYIFTPIGTQPTPVTINESNLSFSHNLLDYYPWLSTHNGDIRVTVSAQGCNGGVKSASFLCTVVFVEVLTEYYAINYSGGANVNKPLQLTLPITTPMPPAHPDKPVFQAGIDTTIGWSGATTAGIRGVNTNGDYTIRVYEVDNNGDRLVLGSSTAPDIFFVDGSGTLTADIFFNTQTVEFDPSTPPFYATGTPASAANYFSDFYLWAYYNSRLNDFSSRVFCVDFSVTTPPPSSCSSTRKSYFRIANNGLANGRHARIGNSGSEEVIVLENVFDDNLIVYPNPVENMLQINLPNNSESATFILRNLIGQVAYKNQFYNNANLNLDLSSLPSGIYIWTLVADQKMHYGKLNKK